MCKLTKLQDMSNDRQNQNDLYTIMQEFTGDLKFILKVKKNIFF